MVHGVPEGDRIPSFKSRTMASKWFPWCLLWLLVSRMPISCVSSIAISCHTPTVSTAKG